jgi:tRNA G18 (ribose-2'-O)-methylase SpoU
MTPGQPGPGPGDEPGPAPRDEREAGYPVPGGHNGAGTDDAAEPIGVGPHPPPWPDDDRLAPELLADGARRNVVDRYRYWSVEAIVADLDPRRHPFHVAIENWRHDLNIGTVVRTANAFLAAEIHIVGRRRWNRRGAMVTDRYQHIRHHPDPAALAVWAAEEGLPLIGIDNLPGSIPLDHSPLPEHCALVFGQEGPGLSDEMRPVLAECRSIPQFGSTRSINAGVAAGIAMYAWIDANGPDGP